MIYLYIYAIVGVVLFFISWFAEAYAGWSLAMSTPGKRSRELKLRRLDWEGVFLTSAVRALSWPLLLLWLVLIFGTKLMFKLIGGGTTVVEHE